MTKIEWTEKTWNPVVGCSLASPGCTNCYAMRMAARIEAMNAALAPSHRVAHHYDGTTRKVNGSAAWTGKVALAPDHVLTEPLRRKKPTTYFVNSMSDLFHESVPDDWIDRMFAVMALCPQHTFQILTKRAPRMRKYLAERQQPESEMLYALLHGPMMAAVEKVMSYGIDATFPLPNVWLGISAEDQRRANERIPDLLATPAAVRFVSAEPLLGPINFRRIRIAPDHHTIIDALDGYAIGDAISGSGQERAKLDWIIVGGESGPGARPLHPDWARAIRDQCAAGVAHFFKQWGEYLPVGQILPGAGKILGATAVKPGRMKLHYRGSPDRSPKHAFSEKGVGFTSMSDGKLLFCVGKKAAGRLLDGVEHNGMPTVGW